MEFDIRATERILIYSVFVAAEHFRQTQTDPVYTITPRVVLKLEWEQTSRRGEHTHTDVMV